MKFYTNRIGTRGRACVFARPLFLKEYSTDCLQSSSSTSSSSSPAKSPPDASSKGIHQAIYSLRGQISASSASSGLISNFLSSSSSGNGSRHGAVRHIGSAGQGPHRSSAGHVAAATGISTAGKSIVGVSQSDDRAGHLGKSPRLPRKGEAEGGEPTIRSRFHPRRVPTSVPPEDPQDSQSRGPPGSKISRDEPADRRALPCSHCLR